MTGERKTQGLLITVDNAGNPSFTWLNQHLGEHRQLLSETTKAPEFVQTLFLGFDLKRTPQGNWFVIEVNGRNAGLAGLEQVDDQFSTQEFLKEVRSNFGLLNPSSIIADEILIRMRKAIKEGEFFIEGLEVLTDEEETALERLTNFNEPRLEEALRNKLVQKTLLPRRLTSPYLTTDELSGLSEEELLRTISLWQQLTGRDYPQAFDSTLLVVKDPKSSQGAGVIVTTKEGIANLKLPQGMLIEPFVLSAPIKNQVTGKNHDACMRFGTVANTNRDGEVTFVHAGGYWRLAPKPCQDRRCSLINRYTANLSRKAIAQATRREELEEAQTVIEEATFYMLSNFYGRDFTHRYSVSSAFGIS